MRITISESKRAIIEKQMARAGYEDAGEYVLSLVERDARRDAGAELEKELLEGLDSPLLVWGPEMKEQIRRAGRRAAKRRSA